MNLPPEGGDLAGPLLSTQHGSLLDAYWCVSQGCVNVLSCGARAAEGKNFS